LAPVSFVAPSLPPAVADDKDNADGDGDGAAVPVLEVAVGADSGAVARAGLGLRETGSATAGGGCVSTKGVGFTGTDTGSLALLMALVICSARAIVAILFLCGHHNLYFLPPARAVALSTAGHQGYSKIGGVWPAGMTLFVLLEERFEVNHNTEYVNM
jgi:hypothetical protein